MKPPTPLRPFVLALSCVFITALNTATAQQTSYRFARIAVADGLPGHAVNDVMKDSRGYMWFATDNGLARFDGYTMSVFRPVPGDSTSLSDTYAAALLEDTAGFIWVGTANGGVNKFDPIAQSFQRFPVSPDGPDGTSHAFINVIREMSDGTIWMGTDGGLDAFRDDHFTHVTSLPDQIVTDIVEDDDNVLWVATHGGVQVLHTTPGDPGRTTPGATYTDRSGGADGISSLRVNVLHRTNDGRLWIGNDGGLDILNPADGSIERFHHVQSQPASLSANRVYSIAEDETGIVWIGTVGNDIADGLNRFDPRDQTFRRFRTDADDPHALSGNRVISLLADDEGLLWIGTLNNGVNRLDLEGERFTRYFAEPNAPNGMSSNQVLAVLATTSAKSGGPQLWVGSWNSSLVKLELNSTASRRFPSGRGTLSGPDALGLFEDTDGSIWIGTFNGLNHYEPDTDRFTVYRHRPGDPTSLVSDEARTIVRDSRGTLWVGSWSSGISLLPAGSREFSRLVHDPDEPTSLPDNRIVRLDADPDGAVWIQTQTRLFAYDLQSGQFEEVPVPNVTAFALGTPGEVWIGTQSSGLALYDVAAGTVEVFGIDLGLPHETVTGVVADRYGDVWVATGRGIARFEAPGGNENRDGRFTNYRTNPMIRQNKLGENPAVVGPDGRVYFGSSTGVFAFDPATIQKNRHVPVARVASVRAGNENVDMNIHPGGTQRVTLRHDQNDLAIGFVGIAYRNPEEHTYRYRLGGYEDDWVDARKSREARYPNLSPGTYTFEVQAANEDGVWNTESASLHVTVRTPWWSSPFAYLIYVAFALVSTIAVVRIRESALRRRTSILETQVLERTKVIEDQSRRLVEHDEMKSRFFANISHEFRTPLTLILGPLRDAQIGMFGRISNALLGQLNMMERNGRRLQGLINQLLELARFESGNMSLAAQRVDPARLTSRIVRTFSSLAERKRISLKMSAAWHGSPAHHPELFVDPERYEQIVNNLISNALKFTPEGGHVNVDLSVTPTEFVLEVRDSGTGIPETQLDSIFGRFNQVQPREVDAGGSSGIGLALAREWVNLHKGSITARNAKVGGSVFTVRLPLGRSHLSDEEIVDVASHVDGVVPPQSNEAAAATPTEAGAGAGTEEFDAFAPDDELRPVPLGAPLVLLVEDNADVRKYVRGHLETRYEVVECENGLEAIEMVRERKPDLIISDVMMGGMDGYELCRAIRTDPDVSDIPIVLLTARAGDEDKVEGLRTGADDYILKPFNSTELMVRAENLIEIRSRLREQYSTHVIQVLPSDVQVESADEAFLRHARELLEEHIDNPNFGTEWLAEEIGLSPRQLRRRIKELTNLSTTGFIRTLRLQRSAQLLEQQAGSVAEIAYAVGFNDPKYFSRLFRQIYGVSPSEYRPRAHES